MFYLILTITGVVAIILLRSHWNLKWQIIFILSLFILSLLVTFTTFKILGDTGVIEKGSESFWNKIPWLEIWLYFCMIIGMIAKYFFDTIGTTKNKKLQINKWQLFKPLLISPLVFGTIYGSLETIQSVVLLNVFAFQNGFFWQTVLVRKS